ncbi:MAG TPA: aldehyde dehydrogenase family protein, partial [Anaeromyxobacteraceae bacterium]
MAIETLNPATGELLKTFPETEPAEVERILSAAVAAQRDWARRPFAERAAPMRKVAALLRERASAFAGLMATEMGKPLKDGAAEVNKCAWLCEYYAETAERHLAPRQESSDASQSYVRFDPLGVVLAVMPWNFPFWQVFRFIAPHLMAGNGGLLKHASNVPQCALAIERVMHDAGFPEALFRTLLLGSRRACWV